MLTMLLMACCPFQETPKGVQRADASPQTRAARHRSTVIPFTLTKHNNISVNAVLNEADPVRLMFHTAVSSASVTKKAAQRIKSVKFDQQANVKSWGGAGKARFSSRNVLRIGDRVWSKISLTESLHSGKGTDGKFGCHLFGSEFIEVDFDRRRLIAHTRLPKDLTGYHKLRIRNQNGNMFLRGRVRVGTADYENEFLVHTGFGGTALFDDKFVSQHRLAETLRQVGTRELKDSYGNVLKTHKVIVPALIFGELRLENLPAELFSGAIGKQTMSVVGGDVLKRFNLVIDTRGRAMYLKPNGLFRTKFGE